MLELLPRGCQACRAPEPPLTLLAPIGALACIMLACFALAGCFKPEPPEKERKPEPQAAGATGLRDTLQAPVDRAKAVEGKLEDAGQRQHDAIEDAGG